MSSAPIPDPESISRSESLFAEYLVHVERGDAPDFEAFCRPHPTHATELRRMKSAWDRQRSLVERAGLGSEVRLSFAEALHSVYGIGVDPAVSLGGDAPGPDSGPSSELLKRLRAHAPVNSRYRLLGEIGRGGMGAVLKIWDEDLRRTLAMKVVLGRDDAAKPGSTPPLDTRTLGRFLEEAQVTGQLDHPGIVPVHELGLGSDGRVFFTMRLVKGEDLRTIYEHVATGHDGWNETRALGVLLKVCEAMSYAHDKGVVHRDLKPANVMVGKYGEVYVMDWGLARVLGQADRHDVRLRPEAPTSVSVRTERRAERVDAPDSPLVTMDGDVVGTPAYMPPEQARGEVEKLGPHSDVYSVGAMLYHLLAGEMPFVPKGVKVSAHAVLMRVIDGPPKPLIELAPRFPAELVAICEKAMEREIARRYRDMPALAEDLRAYVERRVVKAYESGTWAETRKWVQRNKPLAASLAATVLIAIMGVVWVTAKNMEILAANADLAAAKKIADEKASEALVQSRLANEKAVEAEAARNDLASRNVELFKSRKEVVLREREARVRGLIQDLAFFDTLDDDVAYARRQSRPASKWWLERAHELVDGVDYYASQGIPKESDWRAVAEMIGPPTWSPGLRDVEDALVKVRARARERTPAEVAEDRDSHPLAQQYKKKRAEFRWMSRMLGSERRPTETEVEAQLAEESLPQEGSELNILAWSLTDPDAPEPGMEVKGLLLAQRALAAAEQGDRPFRRDTLAWALFRCGHLEEALAAEQGAVEEAQGLDEEWLSARLNKLRDWVGRWSGDDSRSKRKEEMTQLASEITQLEVRLSEQRSWGFEASQDEWWHTQLIQLEAGLQRLQKHIELAERSIRGAEVERDWSEAIAAIATSENYRGVRWPSGDRLTPQIGLVPIGPDPASGLWEFSHLESGTVAHRAENGTIVLQPSTGLVFVLLPGGRVPIEEGDHVVQNAELTTIDLDAFFISKYEMTMEQWTRLGGWMENPDAGGFPLSPVWGISWDDCNTTLSASVAWLCLPTTAQWEYACRAGTRTPWWTGADKDDLRGAANIEFDTEPNHAPPLQRVGLLRANPFGLHDVHGNASEWCRDAPSGTRRTRKMVRGGNHFMHAEEARSGSAWAQPPYWRIGGNSLRPARGITP